MTNEQLAKAIFDYYGNNERRISEFFLDVADSEWSDSPAVRAIMRAASFLYDEQFRRENAARAALAVGLDDGSIPLSAIGFGPNYDYCEAVPYDQK